jgi:DNA-directed RNA polymerase beta' subunit
MFNKAIIDIGESVGIIAASAVGEMSTQSTLNTFHSSGGEHKAVTQGVPRLKEIKNSTSKPKSKSIKVYFKKEEWPVEELDLESTYHFLSRFSSQIKEIKLETLINDIQVEIFEDTEYATTDPLGFFEIQKGKEEWWETEYMHNLDLKEDEIFVDKLHCGYRLKIQFDKQEIYDNNITIFNLASILEKKLSSLVKCIIIPSPSQECEIVIYFSMLNEASKISQVFEKKKGEFSVLNDKNAIYLCFRDIIIPIIKNTFFNKETGVKRYFVETDDTKQENYEKYFVETEGGNFETILSLPCVETRKCKTDDFWQVYNALDIEAAKRCLTEEFYKAVTGDGSYIDRRLIELTVDNLCRRGTIDSMRRDSVPMDITGPIQKMAFEKPVHYIMQSVLHGVMDPCSSASGAITLGNNPQVGTETVHIYDKEGNKIDY